VTTLPLVTMLAVLTGDDATRVTILRNFVAAKLITAMLVTVELVTTKFVTATLIAARS